jgi:hypothetical protein
MCATSEEMDALNARVLQSDLMVAALSCGQQKNYNLFVSHFKDELAHSGKKLREYFHRNYPHTSEASLNSFVTRLANNASHHALENSHKAYCSHSSELFSSTLAVSKGMLSDALADMNIAPRHGIQPCGWAENFKRFWNRD